MKDKHKHIPLKNMEGHATFIGEPSQDQIDAVNKMAELAFESEHPDQTYSVEQKPDWDKWLSDFDYEMKSLGYRKYNQNHKNEDFAYWKYFYFGDEKAYQVGVLVYDFRKYGAFPEQAQRIKTSYECILLEDQRIDLSVSKEISLQEFEAMANTFYLAMTTPAPNAVNNGESGIMGWVSAAERFPNTIYAMPVLDNGGIHRNGLFYNQDGKKWIEIQETPNYQEFIVDEINFGFYNWLDETPICHSQTLKELQQANQQLEKDKAELVEKSEQFLKDNFSSIREHMSNDTKDFWDLITKIKNNG